MNINTVQRHAQSQMIENNEYMGLPLSVWGADKQYVSWRLSQSSYVSNKHKYVYLEVPKAACTTLKYLIHGIEGLPPVPVTFDRLPETRLYMFIHDRQMFQMPSLTTLPEQDAEKIIRGGDYYKFTFVRNPYSRLVSAWKNKLYFVEPGMENTYIAVKNAFPAMAAGKYIGFDVFVKYLSRYENTGSCNPHYQLQKKLIFSDAIKYDYIGRVEKFKDGLSELQKSIGVDLPEVSKEKSGNESEPGDWRSYYTDELADLVHEMYAEDFSLFGYDKDSWKGGMPLPEKTPREIYLEEQIFDRNRLISAMYQWINAKMK